MGDLAKRESWSGRFGALMAMTGMAVGLGNIWRFPYMVGTYGGGAFVFAYLVCCIIIVMPLAIMEAGLGKNMQAGEVDTWSEILHNKTAGGVIGGFFAFGYASMNFFYMFVTATIVYYMYVFISGLNEKVDTQVLYDTMNNDMTGVMIALTVVVTLIMILLIYLGIVKGVEAACKVMVPAIAIIFIIIAVVETVTVPNIVEGYNYYLNPDWSVLGQFGIWKAALGQALFSVGVGPGCMLVYGSHIAKDEDAVLSIITVCVLDTAIALVAGFAIIPACVALGMEPQSGSGLIFIVLPKVLTLIPAGKIIGLFIMIAMFFAALSSALAQLEVAVTSYADGFNWGRKKSVVICGVITLIMAVVCVVNKAQFDFWNNFAGNYVFIVTAGLGAIGYAYIYGVKRIKEEALDIGADIKLGGWFIPLVKFIAVPLMVIIMADSLFPFLG